MQRATASSPLAPSSEPTAKRRKLEPSTPDSSTPTTPVSESRVYADRNDIRAAIKAENAFEALAAARRAELGFTDGRVETEWVLDVRIPEQDEESEEESDGEELSGRQTYGAFKRNKKSAQNTPAKDADLGLEFSDEEDGEAESEDDDGLDNDEAMSALDRVDLSKSKYAKSKQAGLPYNGAKPKYRDAFSKGRHIGDKRGEKHPKKDKGEKMQHKKKLK